MKSHDLAKLLLENENLTVSTHANNHTYKGTSEYDHLHVGILKHAGGGLTIVIGNFSAFINATNEYLIEMIAGDVALRDRPIVK